jgi:hypothetical protein
MQLLHTVTSTKMHIPSPGNFFQLGLLQPVLGSPSGPISQCIHLSFFPQLANPKPIWKTRYWSKTPYPFLVTEVRSHEILNKNASYKKVEVDAQWIQTVVKRSLGHLIGSVKQLQVHHHVHNEPPRTFQWLKKKWTESSTKIFRRAKNMSPQTGNEFREWLGEDARPALQSERLAFRTAAEERQVGSCNDIASALSLLKVSENPRSRKP